MTRQYAPPGPTQRYSPHTPSPVMWSSSPRAELPFAVPARPPRSWFDRPDWLGDDESFVVLDTGQVGGRLYESDIAYPGWRGGQGPPPSPTGFARFHVGQVVCDDGASVHVGSIGLGHPTHTESRVNGGDYYSDITRRRAVVRAGVDDRGVWVAGMCTPDLQLEDVWNMRACALSGDWRAMSGDWWEAHGLPRTAAASHLELVGIGLVAAPGLPIPKRGALTDEGRQLATLDATRRHHALAASMKTLRGNETRRAALTEVRDAASALIEAVTEIGHSLVSPDAQPARVAAAIDASVRISHAAGRPHCRTAAANETATRPASLKSLRAAVRLAAAINHALQLDADVGAELDNAAVDLWASL